MATSFSFGGSAAAGSTASSPFSSSSSQPAAASFPRPRLWFLPVLIIRCRFLCSHFRLLPLRLITNCVQRSLLIGRVRPIPLRRNARFLRRINP
ncbi:hypothetical protein U9M48_017081 [Paspalum notatum var. saurae]|uniref:Uncharacterized protein n=1 Tax=Paspalum notatum var. saurae TaxID=547442 RepID=A0AAQ3T8Z9_PASNO